MKTGQTQLVTLGSLTPSLALTLSSLNWGGTNSYPSYEGRLEDAPAAPSNTPAADGGGPGTPPASPASPADGQLPGGSPTPNGQPNANPNPNPNDDNIRQLRTNYETLKPWEKFAQTAKDPKVAEQAFRHYNTMQTEATGLAQRLGYTQESFNEAFGEDPAGILAHLRQEYAGKNPQYAEQQRIMKMAEAAAQKANKPILDQMNKQATDSAMKLLTSETQRLMADEKIGFGPGAPPELSEAVEFLMDNFLDDQTYADVKVHGKTAGVQKAFEMVKAQIIKVAQAYNAHVAKKGQAGGPPPNGLRRNFPPQNPNGGNGAPKPMTLDDIINDPTLLPGVKSNSY